MSGDREPAGERTLWQGAPEASRARRGALVEAFGPVVPFAIGAGSMTVVVIQTVGASNLGSAWPLLAVLAVVGIFVIGGAVRSWLEGRRRAEETRWTLTERRLIIEDGSGRTELRLANLPDLRIDLEREGIGSISFDQPIGAGSERYIQRLRRPLLGGRQDTALMRHVPGVERVFRLMVDAQGREAAASATAAGEGGPAVAHPPAMTGPEAPVARLPLLEAAAVVPLWFGLTFLVVGLGLLAYAVITIVTVVGRLDGSGLGILALGGVFAALGWALSYGRLRATTMERRLRVNGRRATGIVLDVAATGIRVGGHGSDPGSEQWVVRYRYDLDGHHYAAHTPPMPWARVAGYAAGDEVTVLVDPDHPDRSLLTAPS